MGLNLRVAHLARNDMKGCLFQLIPGHAMAQRAQGFRVLGFDKR